MDRFQVNNKREINTYVYLYKAARVTLSQAQDSEENRLYNCMGAIVFAAFLMEAYLNHIGERLLEYWDDQIKKNLGIENKLKIIAHELDLETDYSRRPFQSFSTIFKFRNHMAHAKRMVDDAQEMISKIHVEARRKQPDLPENPFNIRWSAGGIGRSVS
jgi:hypothetical protein